MKNRRRFLVIALIISVVVIAPVIWWLASPLLIDNPVDEAFPFEVPSKEAMAQMSDEEMEKLEADFVAALPSDEEVAALPVEAQVALEEKVMEVAATMPKHEMDEPMPEATEPVVVGAGQFQDADDFHKGSGKATIYQLPDGNNVLRFEDFNVTNGPDLHVLLATNSNPAARDELGDYIDLGSLKGNVGNQNYEIPDDVELSQYGSVIIYCMPFHVVFATAGLN